MTTIKIGSIIAATDFSPPADRALRRAASFAKTTGSVLHLIHVLPPRELLAEFFPVSPETESAAFRERAEQALQERAYRIAAEFSVTPSWTLFHGEAHQEILGAVGLLAADVVVLGAQGEHEGSVPSESVGDTALKLAERSPVPTLLVRRQAQQPYSHVVACAKGVQSDGVVIDWAARLSPADLIHVVSAYTVPYENRLIEWGASQSTIDVYATREREERTRVLSARLSELGLPAARARLHVKRGEPVQTILEHATQWEAELLIVGRRAQADSLTQRVFASIARHIALRAPTDVMIVSPEMRPAGP